MHTELATGVERVRRRDAETSYFDLSSVWTFAAAVLLPPVLAAAVIVAVYSHLWWRVWRPAQVPLHRHVYTTATVLLAALVAHVVVRTAGGVPAEAGDLLGVAGIGLAVLLYVVVNTLLVAMAIALSDQREGQDRPGARELIGRWDDNALEVATICMGALAAVALSSAPGLVALVLPPILVLHRAVLVRELEEVASTDAKTGLLNSAAWRAQATRTVLHRQRNGGAVAVLILDLDHFKTVNDAYGHLAGDEVLAAVAAELRAGSRAQDLVGRFGGEEFVVLLRDLPPGPAGSEVLLSVAERIRVKVSKLAVAVHTPDCAASVTGLTVSDRRRRAAHRRQHARRGPAGRGRLALRGQAGRTGSGADRRRAAGAGGPAAGVLTPGPTPSGRASVSWPGDLAAFCPRSGRPETARRRSARHPGQ